MVGCDRCRAGAGSAGAGLTDAAFEHAHAQGAFSPGHIGSGGFHDDVFDIGSLCRDGVEDGGIAQFGCCEFGVLGQGDDGVRVAGGHAQSGTGDVDSAGGHEHAARGVE